MFISKARLAALESRAATHEYQLDFLNRRYFEIQRELALVLDHLGAYVEKIESHYVLRKKGGPEQG
jgi:uncharacterized coiled-coil protein SlyX